LTSRAAQVQVRACAASPSSPPRSRCCCTCSSGVRRTPERPPLRRRSSSPRPEELEKEIEEARREGCKLICFPGRRRPFPRDAGPRCRQGAAGPSAASPAPSPFQRANEARWRPVSIDPPDHQDARGAPWRGRRALRRDSRGQPGGRGRFVNALHRDYSNNPHSHGPIWYPFGTRPGPFGTFMQAYGGSTLQ
jgi:hypothetical protein